MGSSPPRIITGTISIEPLAEMIADIIKSPECGAAYNNNTCTKKGHKIMCAAHNMLYYRKGRCWRCANDTRDVDKQELAASEARRKDAEAALLKANDFQNSPPEKKKPKRDKN